MYRCNNKNSFFVVKVSSKDMTFLSKSLSYISPVVCFINLLNSIILP